MMQLQAVVLALALGGWPQPGDLDEALLSAAQTGDIALIRAQLQDGAEVDTVNPLGETALAIAARAGSTEIIRLLLDHHARLDRQDWAGDTALIEAVRYGATGVVLQLVNADADVFLVNANGESALTLAERFGDDEILALLRGRGEVPFHEDSRRKEPIAVGAAVQPPKRLRGVPPHYPDRAQREGVRGIVVLRLVIDEEGRVDTVKVIRSIPLLDAAAVDAARQWRYAPTILDGEPTPIMHTAALSFELAQEIRDEAAEPIGDLLAQLSTGPRGNYSGFHFDPRGADFTVWLNHAKNQIYRNWIMPQAALRGFGGHVDFEITFERDGSVSALQMLNSSGTVSVDRAARNALTGSRFMVLPNDYGPPRVTMQVTFYYGPPKER